MAKRFPELGARSNKALEILGCMSKADVLAVKYLDYEILKLPGYGRKTVYEVRDWLGRPKPRAPAPRPIKECLHPGCDSRSRGKYCAAHRAAHRTYSEVAIEQAIRILRATGYVVRAPKGRAGQK